MKVNSRSGDTLSVTRKAEKCPISDYTFSQTQTAVEIIAGGVIHNRMTAEWIDESTLARTNQENTFT